MRERNLSEQHADELVGPILAVLGTAVGDLSARSGALRSHAASAGLELGGHDATHHPDATALQPVSARPLRCGVAGISTAGKSTLINALVGREVAAMGTGGTRTTRRAATYDVDIPGMVLLDTPGIAAAGGASDERVAQAALRDADILLYVLSSDRVLASDEIDAAVRILRLPVPVLLVHNGMGGLFAQGREQKLHAFIADPTTVLAQDVVRAHESRFRATLPDEVVSRVPPVLSVHALSAWKSHDPPAGVDAGALWDASGMEAVRRSLTRLVERHGHTLRTGRRLVEVRRRALDIGSDCRRTSAALDRRRAQMDDALECRRSDLLAVADRLRKTMGHAIAGAEAGLVATLGGSDPTEFKGVASGAIDKVRAAWESGREEYEESTLALFPDGSIDIRLDGSLDVALPTLRHVRFRDALSITLEEELVGALTGALPTIIRRLVQRFLGRAAPTAALNPWAVVAQVLVECANLMLEAMRLSKRLRARQVARYKAAVVMVTSQLSGLVSTAITDVTGRTEARLVDAWSTHEAPTRDAILAAEELAEALSTEANALATVACEAELEYAQTASGGRFAATVVGVAESRVSVADNYPWAAGVLLPRTTGTEVVLLE